MAVNSEEIPMSEGVTPPAEPPLFQGLPTPTLIPLTTTAGEGGGSSGDMHAPGAVATDGPGATLSLIHISEPTRPY